MKWMNRVSLRMRITLLTGAMILIVSWLLTYASMYNAGNRFYDLTGVLEQAEWVNVVDAEQRVDGVAIKVESTAATEMAVPAELKAEFMAQTVTPATLAMTKKFNDWSYVYMALVAGIGMLVSWFVAGRALAPVRHLSEAILDIEGNNLTKRIPRGGSQDEVGELTEAFNGMLNRLEASFERQKRFSSNVAHELKTPLATLKMSLQVGQIERDMDFYTSGSKGQEEEQDVFVVAERSVDRLIHIVDGLLTLTNEGVVHMEDSIELCSLLRGIATELGTFYKEKKILVNETFHQEECFILGESELIRRIFYNLIENGMKYNRSGGALQIEIREQGDGIAVVIADSGAGMEQQELERIFEPFYCVDSSRSRKLGGAGLGLSIVKTAAECHGWDIRVESTPGIGTSFTVIIPKV